MTGTVLLLGGPAGAGKSTVARAWCSTRAVAAHLQVDEVRELVVQGLVDPWQVDDPAQRTQWLTAVEATCAAAVAFARRDVDVVVDDLMYPDDVEEVWAPQLAAAPASLVILLPRLDVVLERGRRRTKAVPEDLVREQHAECARWPDSRVLDTSDLSVEQSVREVVRHCDRDRPGCWMPG